MVLDGNKAAGTFKIMQSWAAKVSSAEYVCRNVCVFVVHSTNV